MKHLLPAIALVLFVHAPFALAAPARGGPEPLDRAFERSCPRSDAVVVAHLADLKVAEVPGPEKGTVLETRTATLKVLRTLKSAGSAPASISLTTKQPPLTGTFPILLRENVTYLIFFSGRDTIRAIHQIGPYPPANAEEEKGQQATISLLASACRR